MVGWKESSPLDESDLICIGVPDHDGTSIPPLEEPEQFSELQENSESQVTDLTGDDAVGFVTARFRRR